MGLEEIEFLDKGVISVSGVKRGLFLDKGMISVGCEKGVDRRLDEMFG